MSQQPVSPLLSTPQKYALFVLLLAGFITLFDLFVVNIAIVSIGRSLAASSTELTLVIVVYELAFGLLLISSGRLGDMYGRRRIYRCGMAFFILASMLCGLAPTSWFLILSRAAQGLAAALVFPQIYASISSNFNKPQARKAYAYLGMALGLAAVGGQVLGGALIQLDLFGLGWRNVFFLNLPVGLLTLLLSGNLHENRSAQVIRLDWQGVLLSGAAFAVLLLPFLMITHWGWTVKNSVLLVLGLLILFLFAHQQNRNKQQGGHPLLDPEVLKNRTFVLGVITIMCIYATAGSFTLAFSILLQSGLQLSPFESGLTYVSTSLGFILASSLTPRWNQRFGSRFIRLGAAAYAVSLLVLASLAWALPLMQFPLVVTLTLFLIGFTQGMVMTPLLNLVLPTVAERDAGMASGVVSTLQQVGAAFGVTAVTSIMQQAQDAGLTSSSVPAAQLYFACSMLFSIAVTALAYGLLGRLTQGQHAVSPTTP